MKKTKEVEQILQMIDGEMEKIQEGLDNLSMNKRLNSYKKLQGEFEVLQFLRMQINHEIIKEIKNNYVSL